MAKLRRMLGKADSPYIVSLMRLIETQSKETIGKWTVNYAQSNFLPIYRAACPGDERLANALMSARAWLEGQVSLTDAKKVIQAAQAAARELEDHPAAQAAAKAVWQAAAAIYTPTHSLGLAFYGAAAIAYDRAGLSERAEVYDRIAAEECERMEAALRTIAVENEPNPAKIDWCC